jgi:hypothetical protein
MDTSPFDQLKFALSAYNDANRQSNKMWSVSALLALFVFTSSVGTDTQRIFGLGLESEYVLPAALILLSGINISYCVAHVSSYRIAVVYRSICDKNFNKETKLTDKFSWFDLAMRAPISNFSRIYPLFVPIERKAGPRFYQFFKTGFDILFCGFPAFSILFGIASLPIESPLYALVLPTGIFSLISTAFLMRWVFRWPKIASD